MRSIILLFLVVYASPIKAQLCTGSLGDPIVHVDFGSGGNPGPELVTGLTNFKYSDRSCPAPGEYSLLNLTFSCFNNSWHTLSGDHTPNDAGGYYMLINGESTTGDFFKYTVGNLCPNTTYEFGSWIKNVSRRSACDDNAVDAKLIFTVEMLNGTVVASYSTDDIGEEEDPQWKQYGLLFKNPPGVTELVLKITNGAKSGCGNSLALDDVTVRACGPQLNVSIASLGQSDLEICEGDNRTFNLTPNVASGFLNPTIQWQRSENSISWEDIPGANSPDFVRKPTANGSYSYRMLVAEAGDYATPQCRIASNPVSINVLRAPFVQATSYVYGCLDGDVTLLASGANNYTWIGPNGFSSTEQSPVLQQVKYNDAGLYKVIGTTSLGCKNEDSTILRVYPNATATSSSGLNICEGSSTILQAGGGIAYDWFPAIGLSSDFVANPVATPTESTRYSVKVTNQYGCSDTAHINVNVWKKPVADAGPDLKTRIGFPVSLRGHAKGSDVTWYWTPGSNLSSTMSLSPTTNTNQTTTYTLNVVSPHGCGISKDDVLVKVYEKILVPNAFSPNGDGINDTWFIDPLSLFEDAITEVYNRSGQLVYRTKGYDNPWNGTRNGTPLPTGTYYYVIDLQVNREPKITGSVTIIR